MIGLVFDLCFCEPDKCFTCNLTLTRTRIKDSSALAVELRVGCLTFGALRRARCSCRHNLRFVMPNVRGNRATTVERQRPGGENVLRTTGRALVGRRWRSG